MFINQCVLCDRLLAGHVVVTICFESGNRYGHGTEQNSCWRQVSFVLLFNNHVFLSFVEISTAHGIFRINFSQLSNHCFFWKMISSSSSYPYEGFPQKVFHDTSPLVSVLHDIFNFRKCYPEFTHKVCVGTETLLSIISFIYILHS